MQTKKNRENKNDNIHLLFVCLSELIYLYITHNDNHDNQGNYERVENEKKRDEDQKKSQVTESRIMKKMMMMMMLNTNGFRSK